MRLYAYLRDKQYFVILYVVLMVFVTLMMWLSMAKDHALDHILYVNGVCFVLAALYIVIGYYYRRVFYRELASQIDSDADEQSGDWPEPQNNEQKLFIDVMQKMQQSHIRRIERLAAEKREHQDYILSWIHEVKLPIAASRLVLENSADKTVTYMVDKLEDELGRIDNYVEQALYFSRIDSFSKDYFISEVALSVVKESVKKYAKLFINKKIRFGLFEGEPLVQSDSKWLAYMVDQILANALKYTPEGGEISVHYEEDGAEKRLLIQDNGIGVPPEDIGRVFDKGFTGSTGRNHAKSTGMGLYLTKQLALKLGHELTIQSEVGQFTTVGIHFPKIRSYSLPDLNI